MVNWVDWFGNLFSLQSILVTPVIEPLWSLSYEVWFYILIGTVCYFFGKNNSSFGKHTAFVVLLICALVFIKLKIIYLSIWFIGAIAYFIIPKNKNNYILWLSVISWVTLLGLLQLSRASHTSMNITLNRELLYLLYAFFFAIFIIYLIKMEPETKWAISLNRISKPLANLSYTLYLTHVLVLRSLQYYGVPKSESINVKSLTFYLMEILLAILVAYVIYWMFEKRTDLVKNKIKNIFK